MKKKTLLTIGALAGAAYLLTRQGTGGMKGLGDVDTSSPEYAAWYYNTYLPSIRNQASAYQPGWNYQPYQQQFNPYQYQQQLNNPYGYLQPQYQQGQQYSVQAQEQCLISGGKWQDTGHGFACSAGGAVPYIGTQFNPYAYTNPYAYNPYQSVGNPQACAQQGGFYDSFTGQCSH